MAFERQSAKITVLERDFCDRAGRPPDDSPISLTSSSAELEVLGDPAMSWAYFSRVAIEDESKQPQKVKDNVLAPGTPRYS